MSLAGMAQWIEHQPANQKLASPYPVRAHAWVVGQSPVGGAREATNPCFSGTSTKKSLNSSELLTPEAKFPQDFGGTSAMPFLGKHVVLFFLCYFGNIMRLYCIYYNFHLFIVAHLKILEILFLKFSYPHLRKFFHPHLRKFFPCF